ncbi:MAG TPA: pitrilysin family protein [Pyrinomonadaceae bacterium]
MRTKGSALAAALMILMSAAASLGQQPQETPPPPAAPRTVNLPRAFEKSLSNGLRVIVVEQPRVPLVTAEMIIKHGGEVDPPGLSGLADMTAALLTKGTQRRTAPQVAREVEALGASLEASAGWDATLVSLNVMSSKLAQALPIFSDCIRRSVFSRAEVERLRRQQLDELQLDMSETDIVADYVASRVVFGDGPYAHPLHGTPQSLARIRRRDLLRLYSKYYRPASAILVFSGDIRPTEAFNLAARFFADWPRSKPLGRAGRASARPEPGPNASGARRVVVVDMPDAGQAAVMIARRGIRRSDPDYFRAQVANSVLGGGYSSRLNQEIRIKRGLSYSAESALDSLREGGIFIASAQTSNGTGAEVARLLIYELGRLSSAPLSESELTPRKAALVGGFARSLETTDGLAVQLGALALYGLSLEGINAYIPAVEAVTAADVRKVAAESLSTTSASVIIAGRASEFLEPLRKLFPTVEVIPIADLDLNSSGLRKPKTLRRASSSQFRND